MAHIGEKLRELLEAPGIQKALADAFYTGANSSFHFQAISLADHLRHARGAPPHEPGFEVIHERTREALDSCVIHKLPKPVPITLDELVSLATIHLAGVDFQVEDNHLAAKAYERFVTCACLEIERRKQNFDSYYRLGEEWLPPEPNSKLADRIAEEHDNVDRNKLPQVPVDSELWLSDSGFSFLCCTTSWGVFGTLDQVHGFFRGYCSDQALLEVEEQLGQYVESIAKTVQCSERNPPFSYLTDGDGRRIFAACLTALCQSTAATDASILGRLHNAIKLLYHADSSQDDAISLALCFAAIEALVNEEGEVPVNKQVKRHVATLLVQDSSKRQSCERGIGKLYEIRCQVMHGNNLNASEKAKEVVRILAAGVIRGVVCWMDNQERIGGDASWKEFMDEINAASRKPGIVVGVPDLSNLVPEKLPN